MLGITGTFASGKHLKLAKDSIRVAFTVFKQFIPGFKCLNDLVAVFGIGVLFQKLAHGSAFTSACIDESFGVL